MTKNYYDITLAMAGISQSVRLVQQLANKGKCDHEAFYTSLSSILPLNSPSTLAVFGGKESKLKIGLETLMSVLNINNIGIGAELTRYTLNLMALERKLYNNKNAIDILSKRLNQVEHKLIDLNFESDIIINELAKIYIDVISPIGPKIEIIGSASILRNSYMQAKIRSILLAGIRSAVLWKQVGGNRIQLIFSRHHLINQAKNILLDFS
ncbi:High frequency lysogenization protein HflD [Serratia symbiotica]|nr:High frequency lysogenization protein HflD [Serratia symbiotica]